MQLPAPRKSLRAGGSSAAPRMPDTPAGALRRDNYAQADLPLRPGCRLAAVCHSALAGSQYSFRISSGTYVRTNSLSFAQDIASSM